MAPQKLASDELEARKTRLLVNLKSIRKYLLAKQKLSSALKDLKKDFNSK